MAQYPRPDPNGSCYLLSLGHGGRRTHWVCCKRVEWSSEEAIDVCACKIATDQEKDGLVTPK
jgi:hypothetical protein